MTTVFRPRLKSFKSASELFGRNRNRERSSPFGINELSEHGEPLNDSRSTYATNSIVTMTRFRSLLRIGSNNHGLRSAQELKEHDSEKNSDDQLSCAPSSSSTYSSSGVYGHGVSGNGMPLATANVGFDDAASKNGSGNCKSFD
jgi:hypothetical protein